MVHEYYVGGDGDNRIGEIAGKLSEYSKLTDWDENQVLSMVSSFLRNNKAVKISLDEMYKQEKGHKTGR